MKIVLLCVGKLRDPAIRTLCDEYGKRLRRYGAFEEIEVKAAKVANSLAAKAQEAERLQAQFKADDTLWIFDELGGELTSKALAEHLGALEQNSIKRLLAIIGGAYGLDESVRKKGKLFSLSKLTFPHELCRAIVCEQLYRARTIQRGEPYHHA